MKSVLLSARAGVRARLRQALPSLIFADTEKQLTATGSADLLWLDAVGQSGNLLSERVRNLVRMGFRVVVLSAELSESEAFSVMAAGAVGYAHLLAPATQLQQIVLVVENGGVWAGPDMTRRILQLALSRSQPSETGPDDFHLLTEREREVAKLVASGASNREIAVALKVSERTVKAHLTAIFAKLRVRDRVQLALTIAGTRL